MSNLFWDPLVETEGVFRTRVEDYIEETRRVEILELERSIEEIRGDLDDHARVEGGPDGHITERLDRSIFDLTERLHALARLRRPTHE
jgi:hypothetical protein